MAVVGAGRRGPAVTKPFLGAVAFAPNGLVVGQGFDGPSATRTTELLAPGAEGTHILVFFLGCVLVAGLYGAATASKKILFVQALPAALGLALLWLA